MSANPASKRYICQPKNSASLEETSLDNVIGDIFSFVFGGYLGHYCRVRGLNSKVKTTDLKWIYIYMCVRVYNAEVGPSCRNMNHDGYRDQDQDQDQYGL